MNKREIVKHLAVCERDHGGSHNAAIVYGHWGARRDCIRIQGTDTWVYSPPVSMNAASTT